MLHWRARYLLLVCRSKDILLELHIFQVYRMHKSDHAPGILGLVYSMIEDNMESFFVRYTWQIFELLPRSFPSSFLKLNPLLVRSARALSPCNTRGELTG